jgi:hypothetical protein
MKNNREGIKVQSTETGVRRLRSEDEKILEVSPSSLLTFYDAPLLYRAVIV